VYLVISAQKRPGRDLVIDPREEMRDEPRVG
jgi:hypothetical protein